MSGKFPRYAEYKDSGEEWLRRIPSSWEAIQIGHLSPVKRGASPRPIDDAKYFDDEGEYAWTRIADVTASDVYLTDSPQRLSELGSSLSVKLEPGELFLSIAATVGKPCITGIKACIHDGFVYFPQLGIPSKFLFYVFAAGQAYKGLGKMGTQLNLNTETVARIKVGIGSAEELAGIVDFLDYETAKIDALIEKQQQLIVLLQEKRQAVISHAVTKGLNPDAAMRDSGVEWLGEVPAHWEVCRVKQATNFITSGPRGWSDLISEDGSDVFLQSGDLNDKLGLRLDTAKRISPRRNAEGVRTRMQDGDVVVCITGANTGRVAVASHLSETVFVNQHLSLVRPVQERVRPKFLATILSSSPLRAYLAVKQYGLKEGLSLTNVAEAPLCLPPENEQQAIITHLTGIENKMDRLEAVAVDQVVVLQERRTALISAAVTGKIDVRGWKAPEFEIQVEVA